MTGDVRRWEPHHLHRLTSPSIALLVVVVTACELDDTVINAVSPGISVQAVMRPDRPQQFVIVEQTFDGAIEYQRNIAPVPPGALQTPISGAVVTVANLDLPGDPCGASVRFDRPQIGTASQPEPGVYLSPSGCPTMRPGDRLELRVDVPNLGTVTGFTRVPALDSAVLAVAGQLAGPGDTVGLNRDRDALGIVTGARFHRAMQIVSYRVGTEPPGVSPSLGDPTLALMLFVDSTAATIRGTVRHAFARGTGEDAFHGGRRYQIVVAVTDTNYHDYVRTENNEITGRGFANHLRGGIGVFGSLTAASFVVNAVADVDHPREGVYDYRGNLDGVSVSGTLSLFLAPGVASSELSGFLAGTWLAWIEDPAGGLLPVARDVTGQSVDARFDGPTFHLTVPTLQQREGPGWLIQLVVRGSYSPSSPFNASVARVTPGGVSTIGAVTLTKR